MSEKEQAEILNAGYTNSKSIFVQVDINPVSKDYFFLTSTERALIERSLMDWHLQDHIQELSTPETTLDEVIDNVFLVESMNDVELIENIASMETLIYGGDW